MKIRNLTFTLSLEKTGKYVERFIAIFILWFVWLQRTRLNQVINNIQNDLFNAAINIVPYQISGKSLGIILYTNSSPRN
jgi:hypothetical protein